MNIAKIHNSIICDKRLPDGVFMLYCFMAMERIEKFQRRKYKMNNISAAAVHPEYSLYQERKLTLTARF